MWNVVSASCILGFMVLSACANLTTSSPTDSLPSLPCPETSMNAPPPASQDQATSSNKHLVTSTQALQKRLQEKERTIAAQTQQIEVLSGQLEALKQIDQDAHRQPRKRLRYPTP